MKKLLSLVLICAMGFGMISCVESVESQSVTDLRNAKAEQLKALTNLYNAQAEAALIVAEAEAALKAAEAAYKENQTEEAKVKFAIEIEKIKAQAEAAILLAKKQAAEYEQQLLENANAHIQKLYAAYTTAMDNLATANYDLMTTTASLMSLEQGVISAEATAAAEIIYLERFNAGYAAQIEVLKDAKYTSINKDSLYVLYRAAYKEWDLADDYYTANEEKAAEDAAKVAREAGQKFFDEIDEINNVYSNYGDVVNVGYADWNNETSWLVNVGSRNQVLSVYLDEENLLSLKTAVEDDYNYFVIKWFGTEADEFDYENEPWNASFWAKYNYVKAQVAVANELIPAVEAAQKAWEDAGKVTNEARSGLDKANQMPETTDAEKKAKEAAVKAAEKAVDDAWAAEVAAAKALAVYTEDNDDDKKDGTFRKFITELNRSYNPFMNTMADNFNLNRNYAYLNEMSMYVPAVDIDGNETTELMKWYSLYTVEVNDLEAAIAKADAKWTDDLAYEKVNAQKRTENYENFDAFTSEVRDFVAAKVEEIDEVEALMAAYRAAEEASVVALNHVDELKAKYQALNILQNAAHDIQKEIAEIEAWIEENNLSIEQYKLNISDAEALVELQKAKIENLKTSIAALEIIVENAKAALDAAISAQNAE